MDQYTNHPLYRRHNLDSAMSSLWEFYKKNFLSLFIISFAMSLIIQYATSQINFSDLQTTTDPLIMLAKLKQMIVPILVISLINLLFTNILQHYILFNPIDSSNNILTAAIRSLRYFIPYMIIMVFLAFAGGIAIFLGLFLFVIGAFFAVLYVMTIYLFVLPVLMIEGPNIANSISRTIKLVHKNFWPNIGWTAVFIILMIVISIIFSAIILLPFTGDFIKTILHPQTGTNLVNQTSSPLFIVLSSVVSALTLPLMPIFASILYFNGRASEEQNQIKLESEPPDDIKVKVEDLYAKPYADDHPDNPDKE